MARKRASTPKSSTPNVAAGLRAGRPDPAALGATGGSSASATRPELPTHRRPSAVLDTRVIYCGDCLDQLRKLPDACIDLIYIDPPFNSNRNYEVFWGDRTEPRPSGSGPHLGFADRHASTAAYIDFMRPRCVELARVLKKTGSFYYHCDWHAEADGFTEQHLWSTLRGMANRIEQEGSFGLGADPRTRPRWRGHPSPWPRAELFAGRLACQPPIAGP